MEVNDYKKQYLVPFIATFSIKSHILDAIYEHIDYLAVQKLLTDL